jgi:ribosomal protein S9
MSLELICDDQLQTDIGKAIKENRKAIYAEALKQMQNHKIGKILTMEKPTRLGVHNASCKAIEAALTLFESKLRENNELADIINPRLREAENKKYMESEEYKQEQAYRKIVEDH